MPKDCSSWEKWSLQECSRKHHLTVNEKVFKSSSVTFKCEKKTGQMVSVVDAPDLFVTKQPNEEVMMEIAKCISYLSPGPHVFLVVIRLDRFTEEEQETLKLIQEMFGEEASRYTMVLFIGSGYDLEADEEPVEGDKHFVHDLTYIIDQCGAGLHVFNNKPSQVSRLMEKINTLMQDNGGSYYTTEMFDAAEKAIEEEKGKIKEANPHISDGKAREMAEEENEFSRKFLGYYSAAGAASGAVAVAGAVGAAAAAGLAVATGAFVALPVTIIVGLVAKAARKCSIQ